MHDSTGDITAPVLLCFVEKDTLRMKTPMTHSELEQLFQYFEQSPPQYLKNYLAERRILLDLSQSVEQGLVEELTPDEIQPDHIRTQIERADAILLEAIATYQWDTKTVRSFVDSSYGVAFATDVFYSTGKKTYDIVTSFQYLLRVVQ